ncbi:HSPB1-associated protein 1 homolog [Anopheles ziemanni]|uniref:HSPB1-associated protein 1 homolog n=1 Tax=Anopheles ziemanni TaxID=345580 RepID=UPI00265F8939|nr:HSPB1-associated protein 1 homolog [Anopheles ziemanni]
MEAEKLRDIVLNAQQPYVITKKKLPWNCFELTLEEWCHLFDSSSKDLTPFAGSTVSSGCSPQWERQRTEVRMKMSDICKLSSSVPERWNSFSYRNIHELPEVCRRGVNFAPFGFPEVEDDVTFWVGSANAHTPCHYDTYGCNIVVQVYGRKSWILLPPDAKLTSTRIPFEESSVYSKENFYSPSSYAQLVGVENQVYHTVLEPGMALIVPPKWWHFVENLEPSLNFNTWLSLEKDVDSHISECITKILVQDICNGLPKDMHQFVLNPNEDEILSQSSIDESYEILNYLLNLKRTNKQLCSDLKRYPSGYISSDEFGKLVEACESESV